MELHKDFCYLPLLVSRCRFAVNEKGETRRGFPVRFNEIRMGVVCADVANDAYLEIVDTFKRTHVDRRRHEWDSGGFKSQRRRGLVGDSLWCLVASRIDLDYIVVRDSCRCRWERGS